ncbi:metallophosphoesterase [Mycolicibacterium sediminis]|uniref:Metallophosphatase n=1 Tax=Mycolicibacterium sediminis TaxID=1286180 RepID=A0A7I7QIG4_9MYCO|nr:metallophosphoesterase [Mycolicibacterium sediminis]BBY26119.1 metallophosphatase [Mycolicibacterium sediminis]
MFIVILGAVLGLMHLYVWKRLIKDTTVSGRMRWSMTGGLLALAVLVVATLIVPSATESTLPVWLEWAGWLWFALVAYLFLTLLVLEPVRLVLRRWIRCPRRDAEPAQGSDDVPESMPIVNRRVFIARSAAVAAGTASVGLVGFGAATALGPPDVLDVPVRLRRLDPAFTGFRIAVVSDIHLGPLAGRPHTERIVRMINEAQPDLVAIVGDLVDGTVAQLGSAAEPLRDLSSREGTFFVTGNHEYFVDDTESWLQELERLGVQPLRNANTAIRRGGAAFDLVGVNDVVGATRGDGPDFERALAGTDPTRARVLLAHQPVQVTRAAENGVDLQLSGHTHGGQMWPFHYAVRAVQPSLVGLSTVDDTQLYVSRGAGFWGPPVRIGAPPDISILSLQAP